MRRFNKARLFIILLLLPLLIGCAWGRKTLVDLSESDKKNIEAVKTAAKNALETWPVYSGFLRGAGCFEKVPIEAARAWVALDVLSCQYKPGSYPSGVKTELKCSGEGAEPTPFELGYSLGLRILMLRKIVIKAIEEAAPEILSKIPLAFL